MTPEQLCVVAAVARAAAFLDAPAFPDNDLEPTYPALAGFRRMTYIWTDGQSFQPIGDNLRLWLGFLRDRGVVEVWLDLQGVEAVGRTRHEEGADAWRAADDGELMSMRGRSEPAASPSPIDVVAAEAALRAAVESALPSVLTADRDRDLRAALAILDSSGDGGALSDVDWPFSVLPDQAYGVEARRLFGAAAIAWPEAVAQPEALQLASRDAVMAAVNSGRTTG
jgi:hypothetical protein